MVMGWVLVFWSRNEWFVLFLMGFNFIFIGDNWKEGEVFIFVGSVRLKIIFFSKLYVRVGRVDI